jgi:glyoxylase-like metal-dependent hydrolase (beta-lactamase superfamily II)
VLDTHTHADHFSATHALAQRLGVPCLMHRESPAPFVDVRVEDGETVIVGELRLRVLHTPGHTRDSMCLVLPGAVLTGDTLLLGATGRTDLPTGDPEMLYDSLFGKLLRLDGSLVVHPAHNYKNTAPTTLAEQIATNPRLQKRERAAFVEMMRSLNLEMPEHLTEALRTNSTGGKTVARIIQEAAERITFMSMDELRSRIDSDAPELAVLDVREADAYAAAHIPGAIHLPRGQLELRVDAVFPDPTRRILVYCEFGKISTIAAATLRSMGFLGALALDGGIREWKAAGHPTETGAPGGAS